MSQENVELVERLLPRPGQDLVPLFHDDDVWAAFTVAVTPVLHPDFECVTGGMPDGERIYIGLDGMRAAWRDWTAPWATYRSEVDETVDLGDRVFVLFHDFARLKGTAEELNQAPANIWTVRDGKIARWEFYPDWRDALPALGWDGQAMSQENVEIVRRAFEAFNRTYAAGTTDLSEFLDFLDPDVEWVPIMALLEGTTYHGHEGMRQWIEDTKRDWAEFEPRPEQFRDLGDDRVLALGSWHARGRGGGALLDIPQAAWLIQIGNGRVVRLQTFTERKKALEAAGLRE